MSAASAARRTDPTMRVTVLESGPHPSYGVCGIPYYLAGLVADASTLIAHPAREYQDGRGIDLRLNSPVHGVDVAAKTVTVSSGTLAYDRLVLATGARPVVPAVLGVSDRRVVTVRRLDEAVALRERLASVRRAAVVGAGYVGLEVAEALHACGIEVTVVDRLPRVLATVDAELASVVQQEVERHASVLLGHSLVALDCDGDAVVLHLRGEAGLRALPVDLVVLALGVAPDVALLQQQGAATGPAGALLVDNTMATSLPDVYAAGDCVALPHRVLGAPAYVPLGPAANKTGRVAGTVAAGGQASFAGVLGTAVVKVFDLEVAHTGVSLEQCTAAGIPALARDVTARSRAKYYPGAAPLRVRLVHRPDGQLLGGQLVGSDGAALRVDVLATALHAGLTVTDLAAVDLAYAPPYAPVYDPLIQAAQRPWTAPMAVAS
jgi:NADPH-dependent 2,4-dienoyl-CoA reductase/sulfur reductase-like enzyme